MPWSSRLAPTRSRPLGSLRMGPVIKPSPHRDHPVHARRAESTIRPGENIDRIPAVDAQTVPTAFAGKMAPVAKE